jgi:hypothetical protein
VSRYVLRYRGSGPAPAAELDRVRSDARVRIVDEAPRMFLVEASDADAESLRSELGGWLISEEQFYAHADPRPKPRA